MKSKTASSWLGSLFAMISASGPMSAQSVAPPPSEPVVELSPFVVNSTRDTGYQAMTTMAGTRLDVPLKDLGASISIYTKDFLDDIGATSSSDFLLYATGMETAGPGGNYTASVIGNDLAGRPQDPPAPDGPRANPQGASRTRGLSAPSFTRDFFATNIPTDTYNTDRVTVLRGPNAALFGVSSPAGVTDTSLVRADLQRDRNTVAVRYGNNDSLRSTADFNRVLIPNKLAVRLVGLQAREEYNQRPAYEAKERLFGALTYQPFKSTVLRANFETGRTHANRQNPLLPANAIPNEWFVNGRPGFDWTFYDDPARNPLAASQVSSNFIPYYMGALPNRATNLTVFYNNPGDQAIGYSMQVVTPTTTANLGGAVKAQLFHPVMNRDTANDAIALLNTRVVAEFPATYWAGGNVLPGQIAGLVPPGMKPQGFTDFSAFDWANLMLDQNNSFSDNFHAGNFVLEQRAWENRLGLELAYSKSRLDRRNFWSLLPGQNAGVVRLDPTVALPDGQPNPNVGRPFLTNNLGGGMSKNFNQVQTRRATGYLKYDFSDLSASWGKWLGKHTLSGLLERYETDTVSSLLGLAGEGQFARSAQAVINNRPVVLVAYTGPSLMGNSNPMKLQPVTVPHLQAGPAGTIIHFARAADATDPGSVARSPFELADIIFNGQVAREVIESRAVTLQSYWLQDHVSTVLGWRRDQDYFASRNPGFVTNPANPNDPGKVHWGLDDLGLPVSPPRNVGKEVKSYSVVLHWPQKLIKLPKGADLGVFYNNSENFTPVGGRTTAWAVPLPPPQGTTEEYGLNLSLFNDRLTIRLNRFETANVNLNGGGASFAAVSNLVLDTIIRWSVEGNTNPQLVAMRQADIALLRSVMPVPNYTDLYNLVVSGTAPNIVASRNSSLGTAQGGDTTDFTATGEELDVIYNPTPNWRILANVAHQKTTKSNLLPNTKAQLARMMPVLQQLAGRSNNTYPLGWQIGDPLPANVQTFGAFVDANVLVPHYTDLATEGNSTAEQRNWRFNLVTNYSFGRGSILGERMNGWSIGGGLRWQSKMVIGYPTSRKADTSPVFDRDHPWHAPAETNVDAFVGYERKIWDNRINWKMQINLMNLYTPRELLPITAQPWGQPAAMRLAPESRWYMTNTFSF